MFDDSDKVGTDVVLFMVAHKAAGQTVWKALVKSDGDMVEVFLLLEVFLTKDS